MDAQGNAGRRITSLEDAVALVLAAGADLSLATPLGLGKPNRLLNAIYAAVVADPSRRLRIQTALSLDPPAPGSGLRARFLRPFLERQFGADYPRLAYADDLRRGELPGNVLVEEFYMRSGALLGSGHAQRRHASLNYTHVAREVARRGVDVLVQLVAASPDGTRLSLSCNPDLTLDLLDHLRTQGRPRPLMLAEVHPELPFLGGSAEVPRHFFDAVLELPRPAPRLFALPREPVSDADFAIGLYASTLVRDGGSLQIGIGALSDALTHALVLRHTRNADYRRILRALWPGVEDAALVREVGGLDPFRTGLFGASEMLMDGFARLVDAGIVRRLVVEDADLMQRLADGSAGADDHARLEAEGRWLHGAFYLGSHWFYDWLRQLDERGRHRVLMTRVSHINELYGGQERLERLQRRQARFFNTCMLMTALGAACSDALDDGRVVSGVGGQYNFVAMAHALEDARSILLFRASHARGGRESSNVRWNYGHTTIPRHLRDIAITEYGIADLRGACDEDCVRAMLALTDARWQDGLVAQARRARKLPGDFRLPEALRGNTPGRVSAALAPFRRDGLLPEYPLGSDFTPVEQRIARALAWLGRATATHRGKLATLARALAGGGEADGEALERMGLSAPRGPGERIEARLLRHALARTRA